MENRTDEIALATDLYEFTMGASYLALDMEHEATFSLFVRQLPAGRAFLVAAGLAEALRRLTRLRFDPATLDYLRSTGQIRQDFLAWLRDFRFTGEVRAVPEGRAVFAGEPLLEVRAPIAQAQLVETLLLNAVHYPTLVASKAARYVAVAGGRALVEFGLRRTPSIDAGLAAARAAYLAGFVGTSNLLAGTRYDIPVSGTMAHSFVQVFPSERAAFLAFAETFPGPVTFLIDTYDTLQGARHTVEVARELAKRQRKIAAVRIDSGDFLTLSREVRAILDESGFPEIQIIASGGLDERHLAELVREEAPIDAFGIGTRLGVVADTPSLEMVYKLVAYAGHGTAKLSRGKATIAGPKQVWRRLGADGRYAEDMIATAAEPAPGPEWEPLLVPVMRGGEMAEAPLLAESRQRHREEMALLPDWLKQLDPERVYRVCLSARLRAEHEATIAAIQRQAE